MKRIISVSRRTDIPAFYGDWFMNRLAEGFAGVVHPFGGQRYIVSLKPEDVVCFVFWSKNFTFFLEHLKTIENMGYKFYFNYTVTGLPLKSWPQNSQDMLSVVISALWSGTAKSFAILPNLKSHTA